MQRRCWRVQPSCTSFVKQMDFNTLISAIFDLQNQAVTVPQRVGFFERRGGKPFQPHGSPILLRHHSVRFFPSNHFRRSVTPMLYAFPSLAAGSSLACKAIRICLSFVPMRMAASLTVTAIRSSNGDLEDTIHLSFLILATNILYRPLAVTSERKRANIEK